MTSFPWDDYKEIVRSKGVLGKELFMIRTKPVVPREQLMEILGDHLAYQEKLEAEGILFVAGPLADEEGAEWSGEGLMVYAAESLAKAREIAEADPMHSTGRREFTIRPWLLNEGCLDIQVRLSKKSFSI
jgi:uncharacterized protein YciI